MHMSLMAISSPFQIDKVVLVLGANRLLRSTPSMTNHAHEAAPGYSKKIPIGGAICNGEKAISQQMEINEGFTACNHNKFV